MNLHEIIGVGVRLVIGAAASFFAILVWAKTRSVSWALMVTGAILHYAASVYTALSLFGITAALRLSQGAETAVSTAIACLPDICFIAAFSLMVSQKYRAK
jgi:hypothetical protein